MAWMFRVSGPGYVDRVERQQKTTCSASVVEDGTHPDPSIGTHPDPSTGTHPDPSIGYEIARST